MPVAPLQLFSRRVVLADREGPATIVVEDGTIRAVLADACAQGARDLGDDLLIPGLIELHTDHLEPHYQPRPGVRWDPLSAVFAYDAQIAASGITTVFDGLRVGADDEGPPLVDDHKASVFPREGADTAHYLCQEGGLAATLRSYGH